MPQPVQPSTFTFRDIIQGGYLYVDKTQYLYDQTKFDNLIQQLAREGKQVVILIDEYDRPMIDNLDNLPAAQAIRKTLRGFYGIIKAMDQYIRFVFITGISKFSKVGVFSALNNPTDLTMNPRFATALGITAEEMTTYFSEHIAEFAAIEGITPEALATKLRQWYDGFCFVEQCDSVYNPFSILQLFYNQRFANYWFGPRGLPGTPTFLVKLLKERQYDVEQLSDLRLRELSFSTYELETLSIVPLLFQTGYLTIKDYEPSRRVYTLSYPNLEVEDAFLSYLLGAFSERDRALNEDYLWQLVDALEAHDLEQFFVILQTFFADVPYDIHLKHEKYYQTIFYLIFKLLGLRIDAEVRTNQGRIDAVAEVYCGCNENRSFYTSKNSGSHSEQSIADHIYLFEFKLDQSAEDALQQIKTHEYVQKYCLKGKPLTPFGANFDSSKRQVTAWVHEQD
ncbi:MAG: AAA family ATPase [Caldilineaceae bacterium]|nr:AAA family ATPase [Caldilineaceae bacterium]